MGRSPPKEAELADDFPKSDLLPFVEGSRATEARGLLGALLEWVQTNMGTTVAVDSQGGSDTQPQLPPDHTEPSPDGGAPRQPLMTAQLHSKATQRKRGTAQMSCPAVLLAAEGEHDRAGGPQLSRKGVTKRGDKWGALGAARLPLRPRTVGRARQGRGGGSAVPSRGGVLQTNGAPPPPEPRGGAQT